MFDSQTAAATLGLRVELGDLGDWHRLRLVSEYDPQDGAIRINARALEAFRLACGELSSCDVRAFIDLAVAHELYHHHESTGAIARLPSGADREAAADAYARHRVAVDARLDAFLRGARAPLEERDVPRPR